jgi:hypothetical protein
VNFFEALIVLLTSCTTLQDLEITHIEAHRSLKDNTTIFDRLRYALEINTTLERLALRSTRGLTLLWQKAIFPALTVNTTIQILEFAHVHTTAVTQSFLQLLPQMKGLRHVSAPGRHAFGTMWKECLLSSSASSTTQNNDGTTTSDTPSPIITNLTVDFSLGAFTSTVFDDYDIIHQTLHRNRLLVQAQNTILSISKGGEGGDAQGEEQQLLDALTKFVADDQGLSATYTILRGCLHIF